jgi:hypothetical protein
LKPENKKILQKAVAEWDAKEGQYFDSNGKPHSLKVFAATVRVPYDTFKHYVCKEKDKRCMIGKSVGTWSRIAWFESGQNRSLFAFLQAADL